MSQFFPKSKALYTIVILLTIVVGEMVLHPNHWDTWPAFMCMVFFFCVHRDFKQAPNILIGGAFGILQIYLIKLWYAVAVPMFGGDMSKYTDPHTQHALFTSKLIYILVFVFFIVLLKDAIPLLFNNVIQYIPYLFPAPFHHFFSAFNIGRYATIYQFLHDKGFK
jgi:hypothetical protein